METRKGRAPRRYLTAIRIECGIITLIKEDGTIANYRQRGIGNIPKPVVKRLEQLGLLSRNWRKVPELPKNVSIAYEDATIMGRARATYPVEVLNKEVLRK